MVLNKLSPTSYEVVLINGMHGGELHADSAARPLRLGPGVARLSVQEEAAVQVSAAVGAGRAATLT